MGNWSPCNGCGPVPAPAGDGAASFVVAEDIAAVAVFAVAVFSVPGSEREKRYELRTSPTQLGFGTAAPGV